MWDLKVIVALNKVAHELAKAGKCPSGALQELYRRHQETKKNPLNTPTSNTDRG